MANPNPSKPPIINCHTHIFTGASVPPYLAKTFVAWPFYHLLSVPFVLWLFRTVLNLQQQIRFSESSLLGRLFHFKRRSVYQFRTYMERSVVFKLAFSLLTAILVVHVFFIVKDWLALWLPGMNTWAEGFRAWLASHSLLYAVQSTFWKWIIVTGTLLFFKIGRNLIAFVFKTIGHLLGLMPGPMTTELLERYLLLGRFAIYKTQRGILSVLDDQYPPGSGFVVLPMDMAYMDAGKIPDKGAFYQQMEQLAELKASKTYQKVLYPFVFVDPRRITDDKTFFQYRFNKGKVELEPCFMQEYIEKHRFNGFKIYPALGYYPFDERLLPLWKYAADHGLPIMTHCIRGTIFYRGKKKPEWDRLPVFQQKNSRGEYEPLLLPGFRNLDFINHFTHPLNYLCLLKEPLLRIVVANARDNRLRELFGYRGQDQPLQYNLEHLKLCFGHFGGDDEWKKFMEMDRYQLAAQLIKNPDTGIDFLHNQEGRFSWDKLEQLWKYVDWYSIICSIMLQHKNVYSDISYVLHSADIFPLLKQTLDNPNIEDQVLFGTDFYVVRNHKSEKAMLADSRSLLTEKEFDRIARVNPRAFLDRKE